MKDDMKDTIKQNVLYNALYQVLILFIPFIVTPYLTRTLGSAGLGTYSYHYSCTYYFIMIAMLGLRNYGSRSIAKVSSDQDKYSKMFASVYSLQLCTSALAVLLYCVYAFLFTDRDLLSVIMAGFVIACAFDVTWFFAGIEKFGPTVFRNTLVKLITLFCTFLFVRDEHDVVVYASIVTGGTIISNICVLANTRRYIRWQRPAWEDIKKHVKPNLILFAASFSVSLYVCMDKIMLGQMTNMSEVGFYASSERFLNLPQLLPSVLNTVMLPRMSHISGYGDKKRESELLNRSLEFSILVSSAVSFGISGIAGLAVPLFFGAGFQKCVALLTIMMPSRIFVCFTNIIYAHYLMPYGRDWLCFVSRLLGAAVNIIANLILIPRYASVGAAIATLLAEIAVFGMQCWHIRKDIPLRRYIINTIPYIGAGVIMWAALKIVGKRIFFAPVVQTLFEIGMGGILYFVLLLVFNICFHKCSFVSECRSAVAARIKEHRKG